MKFDYFTDSGHGWFKVDKGLLKSLGIAGKVSGYSYEFNNWAYLEEDCDASLLFKTLDEAGIEWQYQEHYTDGESRVRTYKRYSGV